MVLHAWQSHTIAALNRQELLNVLERTESQRARACAGLRDASAHMASLIEHVSEAIVQAQHEEKLAQEIREGVLQRGREAHKMALGLRVDSIDAWLRAQEQRKALSASVCEWVDMRNRRKGTRARTLSLSVRRSKRILVQALHRWSVLIAEMEQERLRNLWSEVNQEQRQKIVESMVTRLRNAKLSAAFQHFREAVLQLSVLTAKASKVP